MKYQDALREDLRLTVLELLLQTDGYSLNDRMLSSALTTFGHTPSTDTLLGELAWLAEQGLVTTDKAGPFTLATITQRGADVAQGRANVPGVKRPEPGRGLQ